LKENCDMSHMINKDVHGDHVYMSCDSPPASIPGLVLSDSSQDSVQYSGMYPHRTEEMAGTSANTQSWDCAGILRNPAEICGGQ